MLRVARSVSPSPSVTVAVSVTRAAAMPAAESSFSSGSSGLSCTTARFCVSVTSPEVATTAMVNASAPA
ncbi:hypothetical protein D9M69_544980 [compost metagenome]